MNQLLSRTFTLFILTLLPCAIVNAQDKMEKLVSRLQSFGAKLPQEQVFVHMDNNCYHLGDTIYYKVYVRREDNSRPTNLSGIVYCDLLNNDGYLVERQMIPLEKGEGHGNFALTDTLQYAGYYELRAYTKWQLNWGVTEKKHGKWFDKYFFNQSMAKEYFRDYEKLYSRVFPVYDRPLAPGEDYRDMTMRPLASYYNSSSDRQNSIVQFFPEGGSLIAGIPQRVAWEVRNEQGLALDGTITITMPDGSTISSATRNRGRGSFIITMPSDKTIHASFTPEQEDSSDNPKGTQPAQVSLPKAETNGVVLHIDTDTTRLHIRHQATGNVAQGPLGLTIMKDGVLKHFCLLDKNDIDFPLDEPGVYQTTVFNADGHVYADRLSFFLPSGFKNENIDISGVSDDIYQPYAPVTLTIQGEPHARMSVAVRDATGSEYIYDTGTMLTESLLASQIRGFVPQPEWFFSEDTPERREALDLLLMVQGWRKYSWKEMAVAGTFELRHMPETRFPQWTGQINNYSASIVLNEMDKRNLEDTSTEETEKEPEENESQKASARFNRQENKLKHPMALHVEFSQPGEEGVIGDMRSMGEFSLKFPRYWGEYFLFLGASDTTKWKDGKAPVWTQNGRSNKDEIEFPEFYVKLDPVFPRFPKPYDYYQSHLAPLPKKSSMKASQYEQVRQLAEVMVNSRRGGRRKSSYWKPAFIIDAYDAFNATCDAGFAPGHFMGCQRFYTDVARTYLGDMQAEQSYDVGVMLDGKAHTDRTAEQKRKQNTYNERVASLAHHEDMPEPASNMSDTKRDMYNYLWNLSDVVVYTDFSPRNAEQMNHTGFPSVTIDLKLLNGGEVRSYQRNRRWKMQGFSIPDEFYSPDYSKQTLPKTDYRRTLYWNPDIKLDNEGRATISLYNNSTPTFLQVSVEGWTEDGTPQCGNVH